MDETTQGLLPYFEEIKSEKVIFYQFLFFICENIQWHKLETWKENT